MDPYRPPQSDMQLSQKGTAVGDDPFHGATWQVGSLFSATLDKVKQQVGPFLMLGVGFGVVSVFFSVINQLITVAGGQEGGLDPSLFFVLSGSMSLIGGVVQFLLGCRSVEPSGMAQLKCPFPIGRQTPHKVQQQGECFGSKARR